jgi:hypothetical protein
MEIPLYSMHGHIVAIPRTGVNAPFGSCRQDKLRQNGHCFVRRITENAFEIQYIEAVDKSFLPLKASSDILDFREFPEFSEIFGNHFKLLSLDVHLRYTVKDITSNKKGYQ